MKAISSLLVAAALALGGCGKSDSGGASSGGNKSDLSTPEGVLKAAQERTDAICACADAQCRLDVAGKPDDPFMMKGEAARAKFTPDQQKQYADIVQKFGSCASKQ